MKILDAMWFTGGTGCVGIVRCEDEFEGIKYFIGSVAGLSEDLDKERIADWGARFPKEAGDVLFFGDPYANGDMVPVPRNKEQAEAMVKVGMHMLETM